jgi:hypothetical protein
MVKLYTPVKNGLTEAFGIDGKDNQPVWVYCKQTKKYYHSDDFYVKKYRQDEDPRNLTNKDFRHVAKYIWDQKVKNQKNGLGWKSDEELLNPPANLESFVDEVNNA